MRLEVEVAQLRAFVNTFRGSMGLPPLEALPLTPLPAPVPAAVPARAPAPVQRVGELKGVWLHSHNATADQMRHLAQFLAIPPQPPGVTLETAAIIIVVVFVPGGRADLPRKVLDHPPFAGKTIYAVTLAVGTLSVPLPDNVVPVHEQLNLTLDDDFAGIRDTPTNNAIRHNKERIFRDVYTKYRSVRDPVLFPVRFLGPNPGLSGIGSRLASGCASIGCKDAVLYQCEGCKDRQYCGVHAAIHKDHSSKCPGRWK